MVWPSLNLRFIPFSRPAFCEQARVLSGAPAGSESGDQVRYLGSFLAHPDCEAKTLVVERPYVDRHYLEEYLGYYATQFTPPASQVARVHVFNEDFTEESFKQLLEDAAGARHKEVLGRLQDAYRGFIVIRPLPSAPIGRTILRAYASCGDRIYGADPAPHTVHFAGFQLRVTGTPFQQQDQGVGACATAALWSSLARVVRTDGGRAPTPLGITLAATKHNHEGRVFPAEGGLELDQMCAAVREFGYSPLLLKPARDPAVFLMALQCYIRSGIPPVLHVSEGDGNGHAITAVGFRSKHPNEDPADLRFAVTQSHSIVTEGMSRLYVHDDRFGPYARMKWVASTISQTAEDASNDGARCPSDREPQHKLPRLQFSPGENGFEHLCSPMKIWDALVPLYPKLRLSATDLIEFSGTYVPLLKFLAGQDRREALRLRFWFVQGGTYLSALLSKGTLEGKRASRFLSVALLPRYIGVIEAWVGTDWICDILLDSTDIRRRSPSPPPLIAVVPREPDNGTIRSYLPAALVA